MFYANLDIACRENNTTVNQLAKDMNIPRPTVYSWKKNGYTPRPHLVNEIAHTLHIEPEALVAEPVKTNKIPSKTVQKNASPTDTKQTLIASFNHLNPRGQKVAISRLKELTEIKRYAN